MTHTPALQSEVLEFLNPQKGETVIDATVGLGGHAAALLKCIGKKGTLIGVDADEKNLEEARKILKEKNVTLIHENFRNLHNLHQLSLCDILFADLGLSSPHIDDPARGFSFKQDSPLDVRFDQTQGEPAAALLMRETEEELTAIFRQYGELERAHIFARDLCAERSVHPLERTSDITRVAEDVYKWKAQKKLPQIFQAIRIAVNDEMGSLEALLEHGPSLLKPGGRMGIISYHSLEDRLVKRRFRALSSGTGASYDLLTKKAVTPTLEEVERNPRARSARFRSIQKVF